MLVNQIHNTGSKHPKRDYNGDLSGTLDYSTRGSRISSTKCTARQTQTSMRTQTWSHTGQASGHIGTPAIRHNTKQSLNFSFRTTTHRRNLHVLEWRNQHPSRSLSISLSLCVCLSLSRLFFGASYSYVRSYACMHVCGSFESVLRIGCLHRQMCCHPQPILPPSRRGAACKLHPAPQLGGKFGSFFGCA